MNPFDYVIQDDQQMPDKKDQATEFLQDIMKKQQQGKTDIRDADITDV